MFPRALTNTVVPELMLATSKFSNRFSAFIIEGNIETWTARSFGYAKVQGSLDAPDRTDLSLCSMLIRTVAIF